MNCPICLRRNGKQVVVEAVERPPRDGRVHEQTADDAERYECSMCGIFLITHNDCEDYLLSKRRESFQPSRLSALSREQNIRGLHPFWIQFKTEPYGELRSRDLVAIHVQELLSRWPRTVLEKLDRTLRNLAALSPSGGDRVEVFPDDLSLVFASSKPEAAYNIRCLVDQGYVDATHFHQVCRESVLTPAGWTRFDELTRSTGSAQNPVFVAMWFGGKERKSEMAELWTGALQPAVRASGYKAKRADSDEHNDYIMDRIRADLRVAPFVVADLTNQNKGVYYEAGFASGRGLDVVHCCPASEKDIVHFDIDQINRVIYQDAADLRTKLTVRILGSIGEGPFPVP